MSSPGLEPHCAFKNLSDSQAERVLPDGVFKLISMINPNLVVEPKRGKTLGRAVRLELVADDCKRRSIFLDAVPDVKITELVDRVGTSLIELQNSTSLDATQRRNFLGFFGLSTTAARVTTRSLSTESIDPTRGLFAHQKQVASDAEKFLYHDEGRVMLHLPTGFG